MLILHLARRTARLSRVGKPSLNRPLGPQEYRSDVLYQRARTFQPVSSFMVEGLKD